jgi:hypothetical protein
MRTTLLKLTAALGLILTVNTTTAMTTSKTLSFVGTNAKDNSTCKTTYIVTDNHVSAIKVDGTMWNDQLPFPWTKNSFSVGFGSTCLGKPFRFPVKEESGAVTIVSPANCVGFSSDADYVREYEQERNITDGPAYTNQLLGTLENPQKLIHVEAITGRPHLTMSLTCNNLHSSR